MRTKRETVEYARDSNFRFDHFVFTPALYEKVGTPVRLRVLWDLETNGLVEITEEVTDTAVTNCLSLRTESELPLVEVQVRWLHRTLGELIAKWDHSRLREEGHPR